METITQKPMGDRVSQLRSERGYTQQQLSELSQIPQYDICKIERGTRNIGLVYARKLSKAFKVPISHFLDECHNFAENMANNP